MQAIIAESVPGATSAVADPAATPAAAEAAAGATGLTAEALAEAVTKLLEAKADNSDLEELKGSALRLLLEAIQSVEEEESQQWRRPHAKGALQHEKEGDGEEGTKRISVSCPNNHTLKRFQTSHSGYTCDICRRTQKQSTTMFGCRNCNWDACVACHGKLFSKLKAEMDSLEATKPSEKVDALASNAIPPPPNTLSAIMNMFGEFRSDVELCKSLFKVSRNLAFEEQNRTTGLRNCVSLGLNDHVDDPEVSIVGFAALHNIMVNGKDLPSEECELLVHLGTNALNVHAKNPQVISKVLGFLLALHDSSRFARELLLSSSSTNLADVIVQTILPAFTANKTIAERSCALLARLATKCSDVPSAVSRLEQVIQCHAGRDQVVEQVYNACIGLTYEQNDSEKLVAMYENVLKIRFFELEKLAPTAD